MGKVVGLLYLVAFCALPASAEAQTPSPSPAVTVFDGRYAFLSSAKVNETYTGRAARYRECPDRTAGPLTVVNGRAQYRSGLQFEGTVGPQGELTMRAETVPVHLRGGTGELTLSGRIDANGIVQARQTGYACAYDFVWRKVSR
jgi:hypothetical protein